MWILIWLILSGFILGVFGWSFIILQEQKRAWKTFAQKYSLNYVGGKTLESPLITGKMDGVSFSMFTASETSADARGRRFVTVIEMDLGPGMPTTAAIATSDLENFLASVDMKEKYIPEGTDWNSSYIVKARSADELKAYLTPERAKLLHSIFSMKNSVGLFFFDEADCALRIETSDPMRHTEKMEKIMKWLTSAAKQLKVTAGPA